MMDLDMQTAADLQLLPRRLTMQLLIERRQQQCLMEPPQLGVVQQHSMISSGMSRSVLPEQQQLDTLLEDTHQPTKVLRQANTLDCNRGSTANTWCAVTAAGRQTVWVDHIGPGSRQSGAYSMSLRHALWLHMPCCTALWIGSVSNNAEVLQAPTCQFRT
jgi:hypothetical protein